MNFDLENGVAVLERTPRVLRQLLSGLPDEWTTGDEGPGTWTPHQVVAHLVHGEITDWIPRARIILAREGERRFTPFDRGGHLARAASTELDHLLDEFERARADSLHALDSFALTEADLARTGIHPEFGEVTLRQLLATWVAHDLGHLVQINRTMARQYREAVGPWRAYLSALA
jgi:hypothetical protein